MRIAIIGQQCSGKTTVAGMIQKRHQDHMVVKFAGPIYQALYAMHQPKHRAFMQQYADFAKGFFGDLVFVDAFKKNVATIIEQRPDVHLICDDIRRKVEVDAAIELGFTILYIDAPVEVRLERAKRQGLDFIEDHNSETEVPSLRDSAHYALFNDHGDIKLLTEDIAFLLAHLNDEREDSLS